MELFNNLTLSNVYTRILVVIAMLLAGSVGSAHEPAEATYLGNEGILVQKGEHKVLFDAFYSNSYDGEYVLVPEETKDSIAAGHPPHDGIDAVFVSHIHSDHFSAEPTLAYLRSHPDVQLYAPQQVAEALASAASDHDKDLLERVVAIELAPGEPAVTLRLDQIEIEAVAIPHAGGEATADVRNLVFRVTLDGWPTVMHMGDVGGVVTDFAPQQSFWDARRANAAFPPFWLLTTQEGRQVLNTYVRADRLIGIHVPATAVDNGAAWRERAGADLFTDPGETRSLTD